jgi:LssY C-terminus
MKKSRRFKILAAVISLCTVAAAAAFLNSFRFNPDASADASFISRAQKKAVPGIQVSISALGTRESEQSLGEDLADIIFNRFGFRLKNSTDDQLAFLPIEMDPDYYSPYEVSYRFHGTLSFSANRARDKFFLRRQISSFLPPHSTTTGFVYGVLDAGVKYANVVIVGKNRLEAFDFVLPVPGPPFVGTNIRADDIYPGKKIEDLELDSLREIFAKEHCCTTNLDGTRDGDPLNFVVIEAKQDPIVPFVARGWHLARKLDVASAFDTARAFLFRDAFLTSPVSPLYVFGRAEDIVVQKARSTINERVHRAFG